MAGDEEMDGRPPGAQRPGCGETLPRVDAAAEGRAPDEASRTRRADALVGATVAGRYVIEAPIGRGGLGRVFRVRHVVLGKEFALKILDDHFSDDPQRRARFYREGKLASAMIHPNIISVVDFGEDERVGAFMVMDYCDGEPLTQRLRRYPRGLPIKVFCDVMRQLSDALEHIHQQDVVHGDIKPDNVLCYQLAVRAGHRRRWQVKLLDFGMASLRRGEAETLGLAGTPAYLAPERIQGDPPNLAADIYSLGLVGYELLTGSVPYTGSVREVLVAQIEQELPPIAQLRGEEVDERVGNLIARATAKDPSERHPKIEAFIYELRTVMHMLGMIERRRASPVSREPDREGEGSSLGFELAPLPMAGINTDGAILVANAEFSRFLTGDEHASVTGESLFASSLLTIYPDFLSDLRQVCVKGARQRRSVPITGADGSNSQLTFLMRPGKPGVFGDVHVTVVAREGD